MNMNQNNKKEAPDELSLEVILEKADVLSKEHAGSRNIQQKYDECNSQDKDKIFQKLRKISMPETNLQQKGNLKGHWISMIRH